MVADAEGARRWANWDAERRQPGWIGRLSNVALVLAIAGAGIEALHLSQLFSGNKTGAAAAAIIGLAACAADHRARRPHRLRQYRVLRPLSAYGRRAPHGYCRGTRRSRVDRRF